MNSMNIIHSLFFHCFKVGYLENYEVDRTVTLMHTQTSTCMISSTIQHELLHVLGMQ